MQNLSRWVGKKKKVGFTRGCAGREVRRSRGDQTWFRHLQFKQWGAVGFQGCRGAGGPRCQARGTVHWGRNSRHFLTIERVPTAHLRIWKVSKAISRYNARPKEILRRQTEFILRFRSRHPAVYVPADVLCVGDMQAQTGASCVLPGWLPPRAGL